MAREALIGSTSIPRQPSLTVPAPTPLGRRPLSTLPKAHLHLHFTGAMRPQTLVDMAQEKGTRLPPHLLDLDPFNRARGRPRLVPFPALLRCRASPRAFRGRVANTSGELADLILDEVEVAVVPGEAFGPSGFIRLSYALADDDLVEGVGRIQELLSEAR